MQPVISDETEWKLNHFIKIEGGPLPVDKLSINQQVKQLVAEYESFDGTWSEQVAEMREEGEDGHVWYMNGYKDSRNVGVPDFEGETRRPLVDDEVVESVDEIASEIAGRDISELPFDDKLNTVLEAWNEYGAYLNVGWGDSSENVPNEAEVPNSVRVR